ncbi:DNA-binding domain-containing protein [Paraburkholderia sp.]|uniref:HvfC/BufC N-terminal domain-containing protein n=1 Tax=Paraburkholderia sp. TaxID=1926495 RepID=UPI0025EA46EA|nr:DNA-binding domain-containing protein [Paraburkholderia sp.]
MNTSLAAFQDRFIRALYDAAENDPRVAAVAAQPGFAVYRNTVFKGCVDALQANFPSVQRLVGVDWFRAAALVYARATPPDDARLLLYGATFPAFLEAFEPARKLTYLAGVARLDRLWIESHVAPDFGSEVASENASRRAAEITRLSPDELLRTVLPPNASARWAWFDAQPVYTIWRATREAAAFPDPLDWRGEGALLLRSGGRVTWRQVGKGACALLDACAAGVTFGDAMERALAAEPDLDLVSFTATLFADGAISAAVTGPDIGFHEIHGD